MKVLIVDISGRVDIYDDALFGAIHSIENDSKLLYPGHGLLSLIPRKFKASESLIKRVLKVVEIMINYFYLCILLAFSHTRIIHFEWLPLMDFTAVEIQILKVIRLLSPRSKIVLTIHNLYPHNMSLESKAKFNIRFRKACIFVDEFIVHTKVTKKEVTEEFDVNPNKVNVCHHGVFEPEGYHAISKIKDNKLHVLQFGLQSYYKGTDILVKAVCSLPDSYKSKIAARVVGAIDKKFLDELQAIDKNNEIVFIPRYLDKQELYNEIDNCDVIILPYRAISQSGVLLLSVYFGKMIICSNLPSFVETIKGDKENESVEPFFFNTEDENSLKELLQKYIDGFVNYKGIQSHLNYLKDLYSWSNSAKKTIEVYYK